MTTALSIQNLSISLPPGGERAYAVKDVSYDLALGEILCVVGESGSGKSMSANAIMGLLPPLVTVSSGKVLFEDRDLLAMPEPERRAVRGAGVSMIFQEPMTALNPLMRIGAQIVEVFDAHGRLTPAARRERAIVLLDEVGLPDPPKIAEAFPFQLSGGQRQRAMIAMALALEPSVLIADEPTTALDVTTQAQILELIRDLQRRHGMAVMFVTHDFGVVSEIADKVVVMRHGEIVEAGAADEVLTRPRHAYTRALLEAIPSDRIPPARRLDDDTALSVHDLRKTYHVGGGWWRESREVKAVDGVSFDIAKGEALGLVGESGSGKSTVGRAIVRLIEPDSGSILLNSPTGRVDLATLDPAGLRAARRRIQMVFQDPYASLNPRIKVGRTVADGPIAAGVAPAEALAKARELLELVGLDAAAAERYPHEFSGGQRQRIGIARALALEPEVIIADEAVSALDVSIQAQILELLRDLQRRLGLSLLFVTHDLRVAAQLCDRVAVMQKGVFVEVGPVADVFLKPQHAYTKSLLAAAPGVQWADTLAASS